MRSRVVLPFSLVLLTACSACGARLAELAHSPKEVIQVAYRLSIDCNWDGQWDTRGSGTAVSQRTLVTARHVVDSCAEPEVMGIKIEFPAKVMVIDAYGETRLAYVDALSERVDAAVVVLTDDAEDFPSWARLRFDAPAIGERARVFAGDGDLQMIWKEGFFSGATDDSLTISIHAVGGNSGSGIFDSRGRLVGVLWGGDDASDRENYAVATRLGAFRSILGNAGKFGR